VDKEIATEQQIDEAGPYRILTQHHHDRTQKPENKDTGEHGRILNSICDRIRLGVAAVPLSREEPSTRTQCHQESRKKKHAIRGSDECLRRKREFSGEKRVHVQNNFAFPDFSSKFLDNGWAIGLTFTRSGRDIKTVISALPTQKMHWGVANNVQAFTRAY
jgi:hypothetical protein